MFIILSVDDEVEQLAPIFLHVISTLNSLYEMIYKPGIPHDWGVFSIKWIRTVVAIQVINNGDGIYELVLCPKARITFI